MTAACIKCKATDPEHGQLCSPCLGKIRIDVHDAKGGIENQCEPPTSGGSGARGSAETPLPGGVEWLDMRSGGEVIRCFTQWTTRWARLLGLKGPQRRDVLNLAGWLYMHAPKAAEVDTEILDFARHVAKLAARARRMTQPHDPLQIVVCPAGIGSTVINHVEVEIRCERRIPVDLEQPNEEVRCRGCNTLWTVERLMTVAKHTQDGWVDLQSASVLTNVPTRTLQRWAKTIAAKHFHNSGDPCNDHCEPERPPRIARAQGRYDVASIRTHQTEHTATTNRHTAQGA